MGLLIRALVRAVMVTLAIAVAAVGIGAWFSGDRVPAGVLWLIALLLLMARWRKKSPVSWRNDPGTEKQMSYLDEMGIPFRADATKGELHDLIDAFHQAKRRRR